MSKERSEFVVIKVRMVPPAHKAHQVPAVTMVTRVQWVLLVLKVQKVQRALVVLWDRQVKKDLRVNKVAKAKMSALASNSFRIRSEK